MSWDVPLPEDFQLLLAALRKHVKDMESDEF